MYKNNCPCWAALISGIHRMLIPTKTITKILKKIIIQRVTVFKLLQYILMNVTRTFQQLAVPAH